MTSDQRPKGPCGGSTRRAFLSQAGLALKGKVPSVLAIGLSSRASTSRSNMYSPARVAEQIVDVYERVLQRGIPKQDGVGGVDGVVVTRNGSL
jgi:hypothetical protein